jgi:hypothetical protein
MVEAASRPATILKNKQPGHYMPLSEASPVPPIESLDRAVQLETGQHNACQPVAPKKQQFFRS